MPTSRRARLFALLPTLAAGLVTSSVAAETSDALRVQAVGGAGIGAISQIRGARTISTVVGPTFALGAGLLGAIDPEWELQARGVVEYSPAHTQSGASVPVVSFAVDAGARRRFAAQSPWFVGAGLRVGWLTATEEATLEREPITNAAAFGGVVAELLGATFGRARSFEVVLRGFGTLLVSLSVRPAYSGGVFVGWVFL